MNRHNLKYTIQFTLSLLIAVVTMVAILAPGSDMAVRMVDYNVHMMMAMVAIGFIAFVFDYKQLMTTGLGCGMLFCLFLKNASNSDMVLPVVNDEPQLSVAHFNVSNVQDIRHMIKTIRDINVDLLSFQELTPDWNKILQDSIQDMYPYNISLVRIDPFGMAMYSKDAFESIDTFLYDNKPNLEAELLVDQQPIYVIGSYIVPNNGKNEDVETLEHLDLIEYRVRNKDTAVVALGDYNMVYWANPISRFRANAQMMHSRRDVTEGKLKPPYDHIFYSVDMECTKFENIEDYQQNHIGIYGVYQLKTASQELKPKTVLSSLSY